MLIGTVTWQQNIVTFFPHIKQLLMSVISLNDFVERNEEQKKVDVNELSLHM